MHGVPESRTQLTAVRTPALSEGWASTGGREVPGKPSALTCHVSLFLAKPTPHARFPLCQQELWACFNG